MHLIIRKFLLLCFLLAFAGGEYAQAAPVKHAPSSAPHYTIGKSEKSPIEISLQSFSFSSLRTLAREDYFIPEKHLSLICNKRFGPESHFQFQVQTRIHSPRFLKLRILRL